MAKLRETDIAWVAAERTIAAVELGDAGTALRRAAAIDPSGLSTERRVRFLVDMARAPPGRAESDHHRAGAAASK